MPAFRGRGSLGSWDDLAAVATGDMGDVDPAEVLLVDELVEGQVEAADEFEEAAVFFERSADDVGGLAPEVLGVAHSSDFGVEAAATVAGCDYDWSPEGFPQWVEDVVDKVVEGHYRGIGGGVFDAETTRGGRVAEFGDCEVLHNSD